MLSQTDKKAFAEILNGTLIIYGQVADPQVMRTWFTILQSYTLTEIENAFEVYLTTNKFPPKPADIIEIINRKYAGLWKSPDEAWAVARQLSDQHASVTTTDVIMEALDGLYGLLEDDPIACRMAFKNSYERIMIAGKASGRVPKIHFSPGFDATQRLEAANEACWVGIDQQKVSAYLEAPLTTHALQAIVNQQAAKNDAHFDPFNDPEVIATLRKIGIQVPKAS